MYFKVNVVEKWRPFEENAIIHFFPPGIKQKCLFKKMLVYHLEIENAS